MITTALKNENHIPITSFSIAVMGGTAPPNMTYISGIQ
ncbi:unnamed protein product, partial [marine sediment metagenome]